MEKNEYIQLLEEYSFKVDDVDRIVLANHEITKVGYCYGAILNKYNNTYEVYSYVVDDNSQQIVSLLLYNLFSKYEFAERYFMELSGLLDSKDLDYLLEICKQKRTVQD